MKIISTPAIAFVLSLLTFADCQAGEAQRLSYAVICEDAQLSARIDAGVRTRLMVAKKDISEKFPAGKLYLYLQRDVNDKKNPNGISVAIAHVSNVQTASLALGLIQKKEPVPAQLSAMLREEGFLKHLSVAHIDEASDEEIETLLDSVLNTFLSKNSTVGD
ncbi:hypothetical protein [Duganella qianjiadongensis]|uniref:Uncharacterized protein n=1 Tax=Duganella qianjiadongensis TaxID=2692176 RepID=A0ABW9VSY6_9BURK|nr:hypothetical protein [Duganella qianjiadongensis]MYM42188.1 hypothetical protein [Duganella qianjiadongensis]